MILFKIRKNWKIKQKEKFIKTTVLNKKYDSKKRSFVTGSFLFGLK